MGLARSKQQSINQSVRQSISQSLNPLGLYRTIYGWQLCDQLPYAIIEIEIEQKSRIEAHSPSDYIISRQG